MQRPAALLLAAALAAACQGLPTALQRQGEIEGLPGAVRMSEGSTLVPDMFRKAARSLADHEFQAAEQAYRAIIEIEPDKAAGYIGLASSLWYQERLGEAQQAYLTALELEPASVAARIGLGSVAMEQGDPAAAAQRYGEALSMDPQAADAHWGMALAQEALGHDRSAAAHWIRFLELAPDTLLAAQVDRALKQLRARSDP